MRNIKAEIIRTENCSAQIYDQHCHGDFTILFVLAGSTRVNLEGEQFVLQELQVLLRAVSRRSLIIFLHPSVFLPLKPIRTTQIS